MPDLHIHRPHSLGLDRAREIAVQWAEEVESKFDMACTIIEGDTSDTVQFSRTGVKGTLVVAPDHFELEAKLGFLLGAFAKTIESQIQDNLDQLLGSAQKSAKAASKAGAKVAAAAKKAPAAKAKKRS